jgi:hypothetical protein
MKKVEEREESNQSLPEGIPKDNSVIICGLGEFNAEKKMYLTSSLFRKDYCYLTILKQLEEIVSTCFDF